MTVANVWRRWGIRAGLSGRAQVAVFSASSVAPGARPLPAGDPGELGRLGHHPVVQLGDPLVLALHAQDELGVDRIAPQQHRPQQVVLADVVVQAGGELLPEPDDDARPLLMRRIPPTAPCRSVDDPSGSLSRSPRRSR